jgi:hypothetical protein
VSNGGRLVAMGKAANVMPVAAAGPARLTALCPPLPGIVSLMLSGSVL